MFTHTPAMPTTLLTLCLLAGCSEEAPVPLSSEATNPEAVAATNAVTQTSSDAPQSVSTYKAAMPGASVIPYPIYPNATKYRIGGENGLKIVVFETEDNFESVDEFFRHSAAKDLARLQGMKQYVRYASDEADNDPWGTHRPGIVIHQFANVDEAVQYGAAPESRTNIIMSYR